MYALPTGHPFAQPDAGDLSPLDLATRVTGFHRGRWADLHMEDDPDDQDDDDGDDDGDEDDALDLEDDDRIKVGDKVLTVAQLKRIGVTEKRQGKRSGTTATLKALGVQTVDEAKELIAKAKRSEKPAKDDGDDDDATRRAAERERAAEERERQAAAKARRADLRSALAGAGVPRDDLDDATVLLDRAVDSEYDDDDLEDAVEELRGRRPALFGTTSEDDDDKDTRREKPKPRVRTPEGRPTRKNRPKGKPGDRGRERARRRGWIESDK